MIVKQKANKNTEAYKNRPLLPIDISHCPAMSAQTVSVSSQFDIFFPRPVQSSAQETAEVTYKPTASVDQSDLEFLIPAVMTRT
jgi:hypothetical protein